VHHAVQGSTAGLDTLLGFESRHSGTRIPNGASTAYEGRWKRDTAEIREVHFMRVS
jgi:hypothetical protein